MESLYKLQSHVIVYEKDNNVITFLKDISIDSIIIENDKDNSFEFIYNDKMYTNKDFYIDKIFFDENGKYIISEYLSRDTNIILKEIFRYVLNNVIERYYIINARNGGFLNSFNIVTSKIKLNEETKVLSPLSSKFILDKNKEYVQENIPFSDSGMILFTNDIESLHIWYFNNNISANLNYYDNKLTHNIMYKNNISRKEDIVVGAVYYKFYKGNYLESLETLQKFYKKDNNNEKYVESIDYNQKNGALSYLSDENLYNNAFSEIVEDIYIGKISPKNIIKWLNIEEAIIPFNQKKLIYGIRKKGYSDYPIQFKKMMYNFIYLLGNYDIFRENKKNYEKYNSDFDQNIVKYGRIISNVIETNNENIITFIKKYKNNFYLAIFNFTPFKENTNITLKDSFVEDYLNLNYYKVTDELTKEILFVKRDIKNININLPSYGSKILSFKFNDSKIVHGKKIELISNEDIITLKNNFYKIFFTKNKPLFQSVNSEFIILNQFQSNIYLKKDKFNIIVNEDCIFYKSDNFNIKYSYDNSNKIIVNIELNLLKKDNFISFNVNNINYLMQNSKIIENNQKLDVDKTVSIIGKNLILIDNFSSNYKNIELFFKENNISINVLKRNDDINKVEIKFEIIIL